MTGSLLSAVRSVLSETILPMAMTERVRRKTCDREPGNGGTGYKGSAENHSGAASRIARVDLAGTFPLSRRLVILSSYRHRAIDLLAWQDPYKRGEGEMLLGTRSTKYGEPSESNEQAIV